MAIQLNSVKFSLSLPLVGSRVVSVKDDVVASVEVSCTANTVVSKEAVTSGVDVSALFGSVVTNGVDATDTLVVTSVIIEVVDDSVTSGVDTSTTVSFIM